MTRASCCGNSSNGGGPEQEIKICGRRTCLYITTYTKPPVLRITSDPAAQGEITSPVFPKEEDTKHAEGTGGGDVKSIGLVTKIETSNNLILSPELFPDSQS